MSSRVPVVVGVVLATLLACGSACSAEDPGDRSSAPGRDVEFVDGSTRLAGTVLLPEGSGPFPAVVILGGSDRSARGAAKDHLARAFAGGGVAALTYDSPGTGRSGGNALLQTRVDRAREGGAAMAFLRTVDGVDPDRVGVCGGSEGAGVALMASALDPDAAFVVAVSGGFGLSMMELSRYRIDAMGLRRGLSDEDVQRAHVLEELLYALMTGHDVVEWRLLRARTDRWTDEPWEELIEVIETSREPHSDAEREEAWTTLRILIRNWMSEPWFEIAVPDRGNLERVLAMDASTFFTFLERSPLAAGAWYVSPEELDLLTGVRCPVLGVWGEEDDYLPPHRSAAWLGAVLEDAGNEAVALHVLPGANHSIWDDRTGAFAEGYPEMLVEWVRNR